MGYRVMPDGTILCDTAEEAISIARKMANGGEVSAQKPESGHKMEDGSRWNESRYQQFLSTVKGNQKDVLELLLAHPHGQTDQAIRQMLRMDSNLAMAGVITGLVKNARKSGVNSSELFTKEAVNLGDQRAFEYKLTESFRQIAQRVGGLSPRR